MADRRTGEVIEGLWRFEALHPEWTDDEGGEDGWGQSVAWWAVAIASGLVLIDPLVDDWDALDRFLDDHAGCAGVVRTCHWHQRSIADVVGRYHVEVWAKADQEGRTHVFDHAVRDRDEVLGELRVFDVERADEMALWLPRQAALIFGDAMIRTSDGELRVCPESWTQPEGGAARLRDILSDLTVLPVEHVLVSHGPGVVGDGAASLRAAVT
jgi:hypothetical protein